LYVDGQRATGGVRADLADASLDLTLAGTGSGTHYSGTLSGARRPHGTNRDQAVSGTWQAELQGQSQIKVTITKVDGRPQAQALTVALTTSGPPPPLRCGWTRGQVTAQRGNAPTRSLRAGDAVFFNDTIRTAAQSGAVVILANRAVVMMEELTTLSLPPRDPSVIGIHQVNAGAGKIWFAVRKIGGDQRFEVDTDEAIASVRGTEFLVELGDDGQMDLTTAEGEVEVADRAGQAQPVSVPAGMRWGRPTRRAGAPRPWGPAQRADLAPVVQRWGPMLHLADQHFPFRRLGKRNFWQDRFTRNVPGAGNRPGGTGAPNRGAGGGRGQRGPGGPPGPGGRGNRGRP
jgi:hypothetical protein